MYFCNSFSMASALKFRVKPRINYHKRKLASRYSAAETNDICVVMLLCHLCAVYIRAKRRAYSLKLVRRHRYADSRAAYEYTAVRIPVYDSLAYRAGAVGIISAFLLVNAVILIRYAVFFKMLYYMVLQLKAVVVAAYRYRF